jgi:hypothetical protein
VATAIVVTPAARRPGEVNLQSPRGRVSIYLLFGVFFVSSTALRPRWTPGRSSRRAPIWTTALRFYFSRDVKTLGYGDYTPARNGAISSPSAKRSWGSPTS